MRFARGLVCFKCIVLIQAILGSTVSASVFLTQDGSWWQGLTSDEQLTAVIADIDGYTNGYRDGFTVEGLAANKVFPKVVGDANKAAPVFSKTFAYYQAAITDFYTRYPGAMNLKVSEILPCLADDANISCDETARLAR